MGRNASRHIIEERVPDVIASVDIEGFPDVEMIFLFPVDVHLAVAIIPGIDAYQLSLPVIVNICRRIIVEHLWAVQLAYNSDALRLKLSSRQIFPCEGGGGIAFSVTSCLFY